MSMVIQSFDNLHDNRILRYCADFESHSLHMDTQTEAGEKVSLHFTGRWAVPFLMAFPPVAASRNCGSAWIGSTSGYLSSTLPLDYADLYWLRRWNYNVDHCL